MGYKIQDRKKAKEVDNEEYIDIEWMMDRMISNYQRCNKKFNFTIKNGSLCNGFTAQRLENSVGHFKSNDISYRKQYNSISR